MNPQIHVDTREFQAAAKALFLTSSRSAADFINGQLLNVAIQAVRLTKHADVNRVAWQLGAKEYTHTLTRGKNKGQTRTRWKLASDDTFAKRILGKRIHEKGNWGIAAKDIDSAARKLIAARKRSVNFIRSGWIPARNILFGAVKQKPPGTTVAIAGAKQYGKPKGAAKPAVTPSGGVTFGEIINQALVQFKARFPAPGGNPEPIARAGLEAALASATRDMMETLAKRLQKDFEPYQGKRAA